MMKELYTSPELEILHFIAMEQMASAEWNTEPTSVTEVSGDIGLPVNPGEDLFG